MRVVGTLLLVMAGYFLKGLSGYKNTKLNYIQKEANYLRSKAYYCSQNHTVLLTKKYDYLSNQYYPGLSKYYPGLYDTISYSIKYTLFIFDQNFYKKYFVEITHSVNFLFSVLSIVGFYLIVKNLFSYYEFAN